MSSTPSCSVLMPMLMLIPLLVVIVAWVLKRGLAPLDETSRRVSDRDASRLDPLPTHGVPAELLPLVHQINALLARLEGSLDAQRRFLADAAHELRSPVAALALQVQLAERAQSPAARSAALNELGRGVERARRLVQQLLDFARLDAAVPLQAYAAVNVAVLAREVVSSYAARAEGQEIDIGVEAPASLQAFGVEPELRSLLENLVDNAMRYAPGGTAVTVSAREARDSIELRVVDAGRGIPAAEREGPEISVARQRPDASSRPWQAVRYVALGGPNQVVSASGSPGWVRINPAVGAVTAPSTGSSPGPTYLASII